MQNIKGVRHARKPLGLHRTSEIRKYVYLDRQDKLRALLSELEPLSDEWANCYRELLQVTTERAELSKEDDVYEYTYAYITSALYQDFYNKGAG